MCTVHVKADSEMRYGVFSACEILLLDVPLLLLLDLVASLGMQHRRVSVPRLLRPLVLLEIIIFNSGFGNFVKYLTFKTQNKRTC